MPPRNSRQLFSSHLSPTTASTSAPSDSNIYQQFRIVDERVTEGVKDIMRELPDDPPAGASLLAVVASSPSLTLPPLVLQVPTSSAPSRWPCAVRLLFLRPSRAPQSSCSRAPAARRHQPPERDRRLRLVGRVAQGPPAHRCPQRHAGLERAVRAHYELHLHRPEERASPLAPALSLPCPPSRSALDSPSFLPHARRTSRSMCARCSGPTPSSSSRRATSRAAPTTSSSGARHSCSTSSCVPSPPLPPPPLTSG